MWIFLSVTDGGVTRGRSAATVKLARCLLRHWYKANCSLLLYILTCPIAIVIVLFVYMFVVCGI